MGFLKARGLLGLLVGFVMILGLGAWTGGHVKETSSVVCVAEVLCNKDHTKKSKPKCQAKINKENQDAQASTRTPQLTKQRTEKNKTGRNHSEFI